MKIKKEQFQDVLEYLIRERGEGKEFVAFPDVPGPIDRDELPTFFTRYDAIEFCREMSTDTDTYDYLAIRSVYRAMAEAIGNVAKLIEKDGIVDVASMVAMRYAQLESIQLTNSQLYNNQKSKIMNQKNFEYLCDQVKYTGFGEGLENDLKQKMEEGQPEFKLQYQAQYGKDSVTAVLNFSQSKQSDMYFLNSYQASLQKENSPDAMVQTFYVNKGSTITLKEAYNLMEGRAVNKDLTSKEGQVYNAWIQIDFKQSDDNGNFKLKHYHQNYGYDLEAALSNHAIKELGNEQYKSNLVASLKKGNLQSATFQIDGTDQKRYIEANPQFKTINIYDRDMQRIDKRQSKKEKESESMDQSVKQDSKKEKLASDEDDGPETPKKSKRKKKIQSMS